MKQRRRLLSDDKSENGIDNGSLSTKYAVSIKVDASLIIAQLFIAGLIVSTLDELPQKGYVWEVEFCFVGREGG